jgi:hypothetical protein
MHLAVNNDIHEKVRVVSNPDHKISTSFDYADSDTTVQNVRNNMTHAVYGSGFQHQADVLFLRLNSIYKTMLKRQRSQRASKQTVQQRTGVTRMLQPSRMEKWKGATR